MARIVVITHEHDPFRHFSWRAMGFRSRYLLFDILQELRRRGHGVCVQRGVKAPPPPADLAILHVNLTETPPEYVELARQYPRCFNIAATDISKRTISGAVLRTGDVWDGPVIVKSNANYGGLPEVRANERARRLHQPEPCPGVRRIDAYRVLQSLEDVPREDLEDPALVVERFIPEPDPAGYGLRFWVFCGHEERCNRFISDQPIMKASSVLSWEPVEVPAALRELRSRLGFDYGKFDFVMHDGHPVLLDANKTLGKPQHMSKSYASETLRFASALEASLNPEAGNGRQGATP